MLLVVTALLLLPAAAARGNLLQNPGFESGSGHGQLPPPPWHQEYTPAAAGSVTTSTAARSGTFGLWAYTYNGPLASFSRTYQDVAVQAGQRFHAEIWARTAPIAGAGGTWVPGSSARLRVSFRTSSGVELATFDSADLTSAATPWTQLGLTTGAAPVGAAWIRFAVMVEKPAGVSGQSIATFDDGSLEEVFPPQLELSQRTFGFGWDLVQLGFAVVNSGGGDLTWNLVPQDGWIQVNPSSGTTTAERDSVVITVSRADLPVDEPFHGTIQVQSDGGTGVLEVYMENYPAPLIPHSPALVTADHRRLMVQRRMPDGTLTLPSPYMFRGVAWSPASVGTTSDRWNRLAAFTDWYRLDLQMIRGMNANTVYVFLDFGLGGEAESILDYLYLNGIMAVVTVDWDGTYDVARAQQVVTAYRDHPAVLCWAIGNEWNINRYHGAFASLPEAAQGTQELAQIIHALDANHPVASIYGEIDIPPDQPLAVTAQIVDQTCSAVDLWGCNIYRGPTFGTFFSQWASITGKPVFFSEYGADSFLSTSWWPVQGYVDESSQAAFGHGLWLEIAGQLSCCDTSGVCLGGTVFAWNDEWWKTGSPLIHEPDGYDTPWNPEAFPDGFANEEYFGLVNVDRTTKEAFARFQQDYAAGPTEPCAIPPGVGERIVDQAPIRLALRSPAILSDGSSANLELTLEHGGVVDVAVVDVQGRRVRTLMNGTPGIGSRLLTWDGRNDSGRPVPSGLYFVCCFAPHPCASIRLTVLR
jgi:hypothetical protein